MKNFKLNRTPIDIGVMKKHLFLKNLLVLIGILIGSVSTKTWAWDGYEYKMRYLYIDASACSWWADGSAQPCLNAYWKTECTDADIFQEAADDLLETKIWYFDLSNMNASYEWFRGFKVQRHPVGSDNWWNGTQLGVGTQWNNTKNCYKIASDGNSASWDYYRPAMTSASVVDNGTTKTGLGTSVSPYQVVTGTTIKLSASGVSAVEDGAMTKEYKFWNKGSQLRDYSSTNTYTFTAGAAGTTYEITVTAKNTYQSGSGTASGESTTLYYTIIADAEPTNEVTISYKFGATTIKADDTEDVGVETPSAISAPAITGYSFASWSLGNGLNNESGSTTANPINITTQASGTYTLTANYNEVLTTSWKLIGDNQTGSPFGDNYTYASGKAMSKKTGYSTTDKAYKTVDVSKLPASYYEFKVAAASGDSYSYGWGNSIDYYRTFDRTASAAGTQYDVYTGSQNPLRFEADALGEYEFEMDYTTTPCSVKVTFPTAYAVNFSRGTVNGTNGSVSATYSSVAFSSGTKVQSGKSVTLTAPAAKGGYTYRGWYSVNAADPSDYSSNRYTDQATYSPTVSAAVTAYACYTEDSYTVTVNASSGGQVSYNGGVAGSSCSASAGVATKSQTISAIPNAGYAFVGWTNVDAGHHITDYTATWNNTNKGWDLTVNADAATTITANFAPRFALVGAIVADGNPTGGMPGWENENQVAFAYSDGTYTLSRSLTSPNTSYAFKIIDRLAETWIWRGHSSSTNNLAVDNTTTYTLTENGGNSVFFDSRGVGSYTFTVVEETITGVVYPKVKIQDGANSHVVTWGYVSDNGQEGGTITSVVDGEATPNSIASGKYVKDGGSITVTAAAVTPGYRFIDFRTSSTYGGGSQLSTSNPYTVASVEADQNIYAQFAENLCTVTITANDKTKGSITVGGESFAWDGTTNVGVYNYKSLVVTPAEGYYFSGWTLSDAPDFAVDNDGESGSTTNLRGLGGTHGSTGTLTANFTELDKIYFRNLSTMDGGAWANVYVYFGVTWNGYENAVSNSNAAYKVVMTQIGSSDVYWAYVPRSFTTSAGTAIAFSNQSVGTSIAINTGEAATRDDYNKALQMYVPSVAWVNHGAHYHNDGYWKNYPVKAATGAGYYLQTTRGVNLVEFTGQADNSDIIECTVRVDQQNEDKTFHIKSAGGIYFEPYDYDEKSYPKITSTASTMTMKSDDTDGLIVTLTSEGDYKFILDQSSDVMELTVVYPVGVGDYRIKHSYSDSGTKYAYSDIIKSSESHPTVSMYYNPSSATMVLQKCTLVNASGPKWDAGTAIEMTKLNKGAGVYQFDLTISADAGTIDNGAGLYDGPFYIKTDCAPGGWANFTANIMDKNTANPTAFDYYFMKWIDLDTENSETKNIKCVIANQYNNAISDTLKSDGIATMVAGEPVLDNDGSVRFSYNSKTNTLKRAYLTGASSLTLETYASEFIFNDGGETDQYGRHPGFVDDVVWTYELTVDAKLGAKAGVRAVWVNKAGASKEQTLIENDNPIISGTGSGKYKMRLVFDFKTNALISSWTPSGEITDKLQDVDVMLVREGQEASDVITFGTGGSLEPRKLVGSLKFEKITYFGNVASWTSATRPLLTFFVSFPFDVKVNDVFGLNSAYGDAYVIRRYAGDERAAKGFFRGDGTTSFWKDLTTEDTMNAYEGYIVVLDNDYFNSDAYSLWGGKSELYLYFPSSKGGTISAGSKTIPVPAHPCGIDRTFDGGKNHMNTDSHWNLIGVPVFTTYDDGGSPESGTPGAVFADSEGDADAFNYFYEWSSTGNDFAISSAKDYEFKAMHGYMVQYHGDVTFTGSVFTPASVAARRTVEKKNYDIELQVLNNEAEMLNRTYVALRDGASSEFVLNEDVYLSPNNRDAEIYTFAGEYDVAANRLPVENQLVQMGLNVHKAGNYTISMPSTFSGTATLVDTYTNTRTNLAIDEYEVNLPKGICEDRFLLELNIHKVPTAIDGVDGGSLKDGNAHKFIMNDRMYILKNGVIYDACGNRVQ